MKSLEVREPLLHFSILPANLNMKSRCRRRNEKNNNFIIIFCYNNTGAAVFQPVVPRWRSPTGYSPKLFVNTIRGRCGLICFRCVVWKNSKTLTQGRSIQ